MSLCLAGVLLAGCAHFEDKPLSAESVAQRLETRSLRDTNLRAFLEKNLDHPFTEWPPTNLDLAALTLAAFYFHPSLDVARAHWAVVRGGEVVAGARPNPVLSAVPGYSANAPNGVSPWLPLVTLDVPIETAGKRSYRIAQAGHLSESARVNIATTAWQVRSGVRTALVAFAAANRRATLLGQQLGLQEDVFRSLQERFTAGAIGAAELAPVRVALIKLRADAVDARRSATVARARIAEAIGLPLRGIEGVSFSFDLNQTADAALLASDARREALLGRADILSALSEYAASQSALQLEIAKQYPDLHFNPGYQYDQGEHKWSLGLSVELPVLYRNQGGIAEAKARRDEAAARFNALQARIISELDAATLNHAAAVEQLKQIEELSEAQQQQLGQIEAAFRAGAADRIELAMARADFTAVELTRLDALAKKQQAIGLLEDALQRPMGALAHVERDPKAQSATAITTK